MSSTPVSLPLKRLYPKERIPPILTSLWSDNAGHQIYIKHRMLDPRRHVGSCVDPTYTAAQAGRRFMLMYINKITYNIKTYCDVE
jgi:hypothetical protein